MNERDVRSRSIEPVNISNLERLADDGWLDFVMEFVPISAFCHGNLPDNMSRPFCDSPWLEADV